MDNLIPRLHSLHIEADGSDVKVAPGKHGIRSHVPVTVTTDRRTHTVEANVVSEFTTESGELRIARVAAPVAVELWPVSPAEAAAESDAPPTDTETEAPPTAGSAADEHSDEVPPAK